MLKRVFAADLDTYIDTDVVVKGWAKFVRNTKSTTFIVLQDGSGTVQLVGPADLPVHVKREDALEIIGRVRKDQRAPRGFEVDIIDIQVIGQSAESLPFLSSSDLTDIGLDTVLDYRPLALRTDRGGTIFRVESTLVEGFRSALRRRRFTEIFSSKIVAEGTEGGANLFPIRYFERVAYLAQSPQFYKERCTHATCNACRPSLVWRRVRNERVDRTGETPKRSLRLPIALRRIEFRSLLIRIRAQPDNQRKTPKYLP